MTVTEPMLPRSFRVSERVIEFAGTVTLDLVPSDGGPPITFRPGQFAMIYIHGVGEVPISIAGDAGAPGSLVHTVRAVGAVTNAIVRLRPGDEVGIRGPYGSAWPLTRAIDHDVVVIAGGLGLAPVRPAIYHLLGHRDAYGFVSVAYGSRTPADLLYRGELHDWKARFDTNIQITVDHAMAGWRGDVGVVTPLIDRLSFDPCFTIAIVCGPEIMMRIVARDLMARGVAAGDIYVSLERNMKCAIGFCGHCQFGSSFICKDGPVVPYASVAERLGMEEL